MQYKFYDCVASRLRRLSRVADGHLRTFMADVPITENQMNILFALHLTGAVEQGKIGKKLVLERSTISRAVQILDNEGYIKKSMDYKPIIVLTSKGDKLVKRLTPIWMEYMNEVCKDLGESGLNSIIELEKILLQ